MYLILKILFIVLIVVFIYVVQKKPSFRDSKFQHIDLRSQIKTFELLGIKINGLGYNNLKKIISEEQGEETLEQNPYELLYTILGYTDNSGNPITDQVRWMDTEMIYDDGDYKMILENIRRISLNTLDFQNISDHIDFKNKKVFISFHIKNEKYERAFDLNDDWVDPQLFAHIATINKNMQTQKQLTYLDEDRQDTVLGWMTQEEIKEMREKTGLNIVTYY